MTQTQKKLAEIPLLLLSIWVFQALELSLVKLPFFLGVPQVTSMIIAYIAFSRGWKTTTALSLVFAVLGSSNVAIPTGLFIASHMWAALFTKMAVTALALEGRNSFVLLTIAFHFMLKAITLGLLQIINAGPTLPLFFAQVFSQLIFVVVFAYLLFPIFIRWDEFFGHSMDEDSTLSHSAGLR